jgi:hypothetical protein
LSIFGAFTQSRFDVSVAHIVLMCAEEKMLWVYATRIVATMKDVQVVCDLAMRHLPSDAMCFLNSIFDAKLSVAIVIDRTSPQPTSIGCLKFFAKAFEYGLGYSDGSHRSVSSDRGSGVALAR